jgi:predicted nucleotidyltransferase
VNAAALREIAIRHGLTLVLRFGSTVTGRTHPGSDVDLGIVFARIPERLDVELDAIADLQAMGGGVPVDVTVLNRADPLLLKQVADGAVVEYGSDAQFDAFRRYAFKRYQDHRRFLQMEREYVERATHARRR